MSARCRIVCLLSAVLLSASAGWAGEPRLEQRVFAVSDLVTSADVKGVPATMREDRLIKLITRTIAPRTWGVKGGRGTIDYFPQTTSLVVNQVPEVQDQIADLLAALRRLQDTEVVVEVKFVEIPENVYLDLKEQGIFDEEKHARENVTFLDDADVIRFLKTVQKDIRSSVMQAPKLTMFNDQKAAINITDDRSFVRKLGFFSRDGQVICKTQTEVVPLGIRLSVRPTLSSDRHSIRVRLDLKWNDLVSGEVDRIPVTARIESRSDDSANVKPVTFTQYIQEPRVNKLRLARTLVIPDGRTAVLTGLTRQVEGRNKYGPPILSRIPIFGDLFCNVGYGYETHHLLVLVTPRIHVQVEEEEKKDK
jgi:type II secretory pathway component GspD/PulD (secretin)